MISLELVNSQRKKKCKNGIECYLESINTIKEDQDFIKSKMGSSTQSVGKMAAQVKEELEEYHRNQHD